MALIICPECGKEYSDQAAACPNCGCPNKNKVSSQPVVEKEKESKGISPKIIIGIVAAVILIVVGVILTTRTPVKLDETESLAAECVEDLRMRMKDPDSFKIRDDVLMIPIGKDDTVNYYLIYVSYNGNNDYGASTSGLAIYKDKRYLGDYDDFEGENIVEMVVGNDDFGMAATRYEGYLKGEEYTNSGREITVDKKRIAKYLHIKSIN